MGHTTTEEDTEVEETHHTRQEEEAFSSSLLERLDQIQTQDRCVKSVADTVTLHRGVTTDLTRIISLQTLFTLL